MYHIVNKIQLIDGFVEYNPIGYTTNEEEVAAINLEYDETLGLWVEENKGELEVGDISIEEFFSVVDHVYVARTIVTEPGGYYNDITDVTTL